MNEKIKKYDDYFYHNVACHPLRISILISIGSHLVTLILLIKNTSLIILNRYHKFKKPKWQTVSPGDLRGWLDWRKSNVKKKKKLGMKFTYFIFDTIFGAAH